MNQTRKNIKRNARLALRGTWGRAVSILLVVMGTGAVLSVLEWALRTGLSISAYHDVFGTPELYYDDALSGYYLLFLLGMSVVSLLVLSPLWIGVADWYMRRTGGEELPVSSIFWPYGCKTFFSASWMNLLIYLGGLFWSVVFLAPPVAVTLWAAHALESDTLPASAQALSAVGVVAGALLCLLATVFLAAMLTRYWLAPYLMTRRYAKGPWQAIRMSVRCTRGHRFETLILGLSFLPWLLLGLLFFPLFYVLPYQQMSFALYARYLVESAGTGEATREFAPHTET